MVLTTTAPFCMLTVRPSGRWPLGQGTITVVKAPLHREAYLARLPEHLRDNQEAHHHGHDPVVTPHSQRRPSKALWPLPFRDCGQCAQSSADSPRGGAIMSRAVLSAVLLAILVSASSCSANQAQPGRGLDGVQLFPARTLAQGEVPGTDMPGHLSKSRRTATPRFQS